jgi:hypothetical protein
MQEVRGSNPLSSTLFRVLVRVKSANQVTTASDCPGRSHLSEGRRIELAMRTDASGQVGWGKSFRAIAWARAAQPRSHA